MIVDYLGKTFISLSLVSNSFGIRSIGDDVEVFILTIMIIKTTANGNFMISDCLFN